VTGNATRGTGQRRLPRGRYRFADALAQHFGVPIDTWDERLSTRAADRALLEGNVRRNKRKHVVDQIAAVLILQGYLDRHRGTLPAD